MRLSVLDALARGLYSLRANWELVLAQVAQNLAVGALFVLSFVPVLVAVGFTAFGELVREPARFGEEVGSQLGRLAAGGLGFGGPLLGGLAGMLLVWAMAFVVLSFFHGGLLGVLNAADRQAPPGRPRGWRWFRTFSVPLFSGWGGRLLGRYVGLLLLFLLVWLACACAVVGVVVAAGLGAGKWGSGAGLGTGCAVLVPILFLVWVLWTWSWLALAAAAPEEATPIGAARAAIHLVGHRMGALLFISVLWLLAILLIAAASVGWNVLAGVGRFGAAGALGWIAVGNLLQVVVGGALNVVLYGTAVALVRSELAAPALAAGGTRAGSAGGAPS